MFETYIVTYLYDIGTLHFPIAYKYIGVNNTRYPNDYYFEIILNVMV